MKKRKGAKTKEFFNRLSNITDQPYEVELVKPVMEHREQIFVGFLLLQYAK